MTPQAHLPTSIQSEGGVQPCPGDAHAHVGDVLRSADAQWLEDLATLERIEQQALYQDPCFFMAMADVMSRRKA